MNLIAQHPLRVLWSCTSNDSLLQQWKMDKLAGKEQETLPGSQLVGSLGSPPGWSEQEVIFRHLLHRLLILTQAARNVIILLHFNSVQAIGSTWLLHPPAETGDDRALLIPSPLTLWIKYCRPQAYIFLSQLENAALCSHRLHVKLCNMAAVL